MGAAIEKTRPMMQTPTGSTSRWRRANRQGRLVLIVGSGRTRTPRQNSRHRNNRQVTVLAWTMTFTEALFFLVCWRVIASRFVTMGGGNWTNQLYIRIKLNVRKQCLQRIQPADCCWTAVVTFGLFGRCAYGNQGREKIYMNDDQRGTGHDTNETTSLQ